MATQANKFVIIAGFEIDATLSEGHKFPATATDFPVERGADITDHVRNTSLHVAIEGIVSDTPIGVMVDKRAGTSLPSDDALAHLMSIRNAREPVTIETSLAVYDNMLMLDLDVPRDAHTGDAIRFSAEFKQVTIITNNRTVVKTSSPRGRKKQKLGNLVLVQASTDIFERTGGSTAVRSLASLVGYR